jgi:hypothetical protein
VSEEYFPDLPNKRHPYLISVRTYTGVLSNIFRVINYFGVTASSTSLTYPKNPFIAGSLFGVMLNFSVFAVISVQSKAFRKSIENCVEKILCRFLAKKKVFYTISSSEVWIQIVLEAFSLNPIAFQISLLSELLLHNKPKTTILDMFEISDNILPLFFSSIFLDLITLLQLLLDEFSPK